MIPRRDLVFVGKVLVANLAFDIVVLEAKAAIETLLDLYPLNTTLYPRVIAEGFALGCFFSQVVALAVWTALFSGSNLLRILLGTLALTCSIYLLAALATTLRIDGIYLKHTRDILGTGWLFTAAVFSCIQIPLWMMRGILQLRIAQEGIKECSPQSNRQLTLLQVFGMTGYLAAAIGVARGGIVLYGVQAFGILVLALTLISIAFEVPYLWLMLGTKKLVWGIVSLLVISEFLVVVGSRAYVLVTPGISPRDWPLVLGGFRGVQIATLVVAIANGIAARASGYRLAATMPFVSHARHDSPGVPRGIPAQSMTERN
ncbi:MAG: hypothetical protein HY288_07885 [Planctomycetia bacterium]|nr:hypothetical protein [Planctomycetia bacterium]